LCQAFLWSSDVVSLCLSGFLSPRAATIDRREAKRSHIMDPAKDTILQKPLIKANRVMTIHQRPISKKIDYGTIGFEKNVSGQVLIFSSR
jgi:hypothetical protein